MFGEVNESVKAYGVGGHRHVAEIEQELRRPGDRRWPGPGREPGVRGVDFLPHLVPMTRGILSRATSGPPGRLPSASSTTSTPKPMRARPSSTS